MSERVRYWATTLLLVGGTIVLFEPAGPLGSRIIDWRTDRAAARQLGRVWDAAQAGSSTLSQGGMALVEVLDYECPYCRQSQDAVEEFLQASDGVTVGILHYPLEFHPKARRGALYAICAERQGAFLSAHRHLISSDDWKHGDPEVVAHELGMSDPRSFAECVASESAQNELAAHIRLVRESRIDATPALIGPGGIHLGAFDSADISKIAKRE